MFRVNNCRKRSVVWRFYKAVDSRSVQCLLCKGYQSRQCHGSTTAMLRHLRVKHPKEVAKKSKGLIPESTNGDVDMETNGEQFCSVEVALEEGDSNNPTTVNDSDPHSSINGITEAAEGAAAEQMTHEEASDRPVIHTGHKRSLIWKYFDHLERLDAARCHTCMKKLQFSESSSTSNLRRHLSNRHPELFAKLVAETCRSRQSNSALSSNPNVDTSIVPENVAATQQKVFSVEVALEDGDSDTRTAVNESDAHSINGIAEAAQGLAAEQMTQEEASDGLPVTRTEHTRSSIWKYFDHLKSLDAARCHICMKKFHCSHNSGDRNLRRHMSKRHPVIMDKLLTEACISQASNSAPRSKGNEDMRTAPENVATTRHKLFSDLRECDREKRVLRREQELIEALRRAQKEEARALEHQRELLEKLHAAHAKETTAEREKIESLRKAQQQEAKDISRQREELQKEKEELQKKWEELQQEREQLILFPQGQ
ncbi:uncharacterized protein [Channa argus]|uniref:uncharacterized protein n=1 Tax=Channa argus TaxID=215402 RepID=UPI002946799C|nr:hypothetical protein Q8A73_002441 [Channa argus]